MNELISQFLQGQGADVVKNLVGSVGFSQEQATGFLGSLGDQVMSLFQGGKLDLSSILENNAVSELTSKLDVGQLASSVGVDTGAAEKGLSTALPSLVDFVKDKAGDASGLLGLLGGDGGDVADKLGGIAGKLFGK